jgi:ubiquinone/menaquinone biosynthesis C-methylase UbiE
MAEPMSVNALYPDHRSYWNAKADREADREARDPRKRVHTDLHWRQVRGCLPGVRRILDAGGGSGRFSLPLAAKGYEVVHLDLSPEMLAQARLAAEASGLETITFVEGAVADLSRFDDDGFDLVLCFDAPISFSYPRHDRALAELVRVTRQSLVISVMNRLSHLPVWIEGDITFIGRFHTTRRLLEEGVCEPDEVVLSVFPQMIPAIYAYHPEEIRGKLEALGCEVLHMSAPGGLARLISDEVMAKIAADEALYAEFLDFAAAFSDSPHTLGVAAATAGSLLVSARKRVL